MDSPDSLGFPQLFDVSNAEVDQADEDAVEGTPTRFNRGAPLATRLRAIYLGDIIARNSDVPRAELPQNVFFAEGNVPPAIG